MIEHYDYLEREQTAFYPRIPDRGYSWDEEAKAVEVDGTVKKHLKPPFLVVSPESTQSEAKDILKDTKLFLKFAELPPTRESVLAFANEYGRLGRGEMLDKPGSVTYGEPLLYWLQEIADLKLTVDLWEWLTKKNVAVLRRVIHWHSPSNVGYLLASKEALSELYRTDLSDLDKVRTTLTRFGPYSFGNIADPEILARTKQGETRLPATYLLQSRINRKLKGHKVLPRLLLNEENSLEPYLMPDSLLAAMWLQFFQAVLGERRYERCPVCGQWEDISKDTGRRASWNVHENCANRRRVAEYRKRHRKKRADKKRRTK